MTKNQTVDLLKSQMPGFYSVEQVINLIEKIEEGSSRKITTLDIQRAIDKVISWADNNEEDLVDRDSVEFELSYDNRIEVVGVPIQLENLREALENNFMDFGEDEVEVEEEKEENEL
tara:strand:- start:640 stop:990 length:351 start_codon:yes stop_codon:yes gene_type:complete